MKNILGRCLLVAVLFIGASSAMASTDYISNAYGRCHQSLGGIWNVVVDQYCRGVKKKIYENRKPAGNTDFYEYSFDGGLRLNVPGDWNSQSPELKYYEGTVWYGRHFKGVKEAGKRYFLYFAGVSYRCNVYLNGSKIASHEGSFTPFQVEVTDNMTDGDNMLVVEVDNRRTTDAIPAMSFDWWNYGGITRDVLLVTLPETFISYYQIQLDKHRPDLIHARVSLSGKKAGEEVSIKIPGLKKALTAKTDANGEVACDFKVKGLKRWSPEEPCLYKVSISTSADSVSEEIGFRNIEAKGTDIFLNGRKVFLRSVSVHEEIPQRKGRACSEGDARYLLSEAKALGANMIRMAHYQQNEYMIRLAEKMGFIVWQEIPVWQSIDFGNRETLVKAKRMLKETIRRDINRCADCFWSIANETKDSEERNAFLKELLQTGKSIDTTRLYTAAFNTARYDKDRKAFVLKDGMTDCLDMISINRYMGWYSGWPVAPAECRWEVTPGKPLFFSEFGGEAVYGQSGDENVASSWSEDYQARLYRDNIEMFKNIPNLCGVSPWILFDFRSPLRMHPLNQDGWNRKGLISDRGQRKKAWYVMHDYYLSLKTRYEKQ